MFCWVMPCVGEQVGKIPVDRHTCRYYQFLQAYGAASARGGNNIERQIKAHIKASPALRRDYRVRLENGNYPHAKTIFCTAVEG